MYTRLDNCPALVLNADYRPLSYFPLSLWSWQDTVKAVFMDRVQILSEYDEVVHSPNFEMRAPSVIVLNEYVSQAKASPAFTRFNVYLRDHFTCQYCGTPFKTQHLTFDHVIPRAKGGGTSWDNIVAACRECNLLKGSYMTFECHMYPLRAPRQPTIQDLQSIGRSFPPNFLHESWSDYLYWDTELDF